MNDIPKQGYNFTLTSVVSGEDKKLRDNRSLLDRLVHYALRLTSTLVFSLLLTRISLALNSIEMNWTRQIIAQTVLLLILLLASRFYKVSFLVFLGGAIIILITIVMNLAGQLTGLYNSLVQPVIDLFTSGFRYFFENGTASAEQISSYSLVIGLFLTLLCFFAIYLSSHPWLMLIALGTVLTVNFEEWASGDYILFFIGTVCFLIMLSMQKHFLGQNTRANSILAPRSWSFKESTKRLITALIVTAVVAGVHTVIPRDFFYNNAIDRFISRLTGTSNLEDSIGYIEFSIAEAGFYPLENRLGGPVNPSNELFMYVNTGPQSFYVRGSVFREYTGTGWIQDSMEQNWLLNHPRNSNIQARIMGLTVDGLDETDDFREPSMPLINQDYTLTPVAEQQVIFNGGRIDSITGAGSQDEIFAYFNPSGTLYADRTVPAEGYLVEGQIFQTKAIHNAEKLQNFLLGLGPMPGELILDTTDHTLWTNLHNSNYLLNFIRDNEPVLYKIISDNSLSVAGKALSLREWVAANMTYRLDVSVPPIDKDFVQHVLETKEGYCTYSATLLTALCRLADIPARYVEGFVIPADAAAEYTPTARAIDGNSAHAWTEIFLDEIGWLPIDGTPSADLDRITGQDQLPEPTPSPIPTEEPEKTESLPTEPEYPEDPAEQEPGDTPLSEEDESGGFSRFLKSLGQILLFILKLLLAVLPVTLYLYWRIRVYRQRHNPDWLHSHFADKTAEMLIAIRQDLEQIWGLQGILQEPGQTLYQWFTAAAQESDESWHAVEMIEEAIYSVDMGELSEEEWRSLMIFYSREEEHLKDNIPKIKWLFSRFLWSSKHPL